MKDPSEEADFTLSPQCAWTLEKEISWQVSGPRLMPVLPSSSLTSSTEPLHSAFSCANLISNVKLAQSYRGLCGLLIRAMSRNTPPRSGTFISLPCPQDGREWGENRWMLISPHCLQQQSVLSHAEKREAVQFVEAKLEKCRERTDGKFSSLSILLL